MLASRRRRSFVYMLHVGYLYRIAMLNRGESPLKDEGLLIEVASAGEFSCTADFSKIAECDAASLAIQAPFLGKQDLLPDFTPLIKGRRNAGRYLMSGTLVVLGSTITPGTTAGMARGDLRSRVGAHRRGGLRPRARPRAGGGRLVVPEYPGARPGLIGGIDEVSTAQVVELYAPVLMAGTVITMIAAAAEVTKTTENIFRDLQIAAVNQLAFSCEAMGINAYACPGRGGVAQGRGDRTRHPLTGGRRPGGGRRVPGVAVVEVVGHVGEVKDVGISEEGLVGAEKAFHRRDWRRGSR